MTMLEKLARILCAIDDVDPDSSLGGDGQNFLWMEYADVHVRAILKRLREPTDEMLAAGFDDYPSIWTSGITPEDRVGIWRAMIDAILTQEAASTRSTP